jgi:LacI family transcriptional regulator
MNDVAALAGVGLKTVSRVVNGEPNVRPDKIERVQRAIAELGFTRNDGARMLRTGSTATVGLVVDFLSDPFNAEIAQAIEQEAFERHSHVITGSTLADAARTRDLVRAFGSRRVDGLIITPPESGSSTFLLEEMNAGTRIVYIDRPPLEIDGDRVLADNRGGARVGVQHLIELGHRRIACLSHFATNYTARERVAGYSDALAASGIQWDDRLVYAAQPDVAGTRASLERMRALDDPPTAVFTTNNRATAAFLKATAGTNALALVGFDDFELATAIQPSVTVVAQSPAEMGRQAAMLLFATPRESGAPSRHITIATELIIRGSSLRHGSASA